MTIPSLNPNGGGLNNTNFIVKQPGENKNSQNVSIKTEYSIEQFRKDYEQTLESKVLPYLRQYETERKQRLVGALASAVVLCVLAVIIFIFGPNGSSTVKLSMLCICGAILVWSLIKKSFEKKIKNKILPVLMQSIPGFYWQNTPPVTENEIAECRIIPIAQKCRREFDDCFLGEYREVPVAISECKYVFGSGNNSRTVFQGVVIKVKMNKSFDGMTLIRAKKTYNPDKKDLVKKFGLSEVKLEDPEFDKLYHIFSTDQIEARYLITTAFMERLKNIQFAFDAQYISCSFHGEYVYIAPHTGNDLFSLCSLVKPVDNREQFITLFKEFSSILELVDHFKLDKKLGL